MPMQGGNFHISKYLSNVAVKYSNSEYIADKVFQKVSVKFESDFFPVWNRDFRVADTIRANGAPANEYTWGVTTGTYYCQEHAIAEALTSRDMANADDVFNLEADTVEFLTDKIMLQSEYSLMQLLFTTTAIGSSETKTTATSMAYNTTTSAPIQDVNSASSAVTLQSGVRPNIGVMGEQPYIRIRNNPNLYERIKYTERAIMTEELMAACFDIDTLYVGRSIYDSAKLSWPTDVESMTSIWGNYFWLGYINPATGRKKLSYGGTLESRPFQVKTWKEDARDATMYEVSRVYTHKTFATACGFLFINAALV